MKRIGNLFDAVVDRENLRLAFWKASRGKASRPDRAAFAAHLDRELASLATGLLDGSYPIGQYTQFTICDPKERVITAAPFRERVLQHALLNVCEPFFDRWLIYDTYASRVGKGQLAAVKRAAQLARRNRWFLKCDFRKYFDSIPHEGIRKMLLRRFKDRRLLTWFERILDTYHVSPGHGLPIGNLTSLGYRIYPGRMGLSRLSRDRYRRNLGRVERWRKRGRMDDAEAQRRSDALGAFVAHADSLSWRREIHKRIFM